MKHPTQTPVSVATRGYRPLDGTSPRVTLSSTRVDEKTRNQFEAWMIALGIKQGVLTDLLVRFSIVNGFTAWAKKEGAPASTPRAPMPNPKSPQRADSSSSVNRKQ
jgi:hypothetical protein